MVEENQFNKLLNRMKDEVLLGVQHGFFEYSIGGEIKQGKIHVTMKAGRSHKFIFSPEDISHDNDN